MAQSKTGYTTQTRLNTMHYMVVLSYAPHYPHIPYTFNFVSRPISHDLKCSLQEFSASTVK